MTIVEDRILILAPYGRDARVIESLLAKEGLESHVCDEIGDLLEGLALGAACALIAEEAASEATLDLLAGWIQTQPLWSDFPFVLLVGKGRNSVFDAAARGVRQLGNVVLVERPVHGDTLVSIARGASRARRRQYSARALLVERAETAERLQQADRRKDEFLAMLAHELRNPLAPIRNAAEALKMVETGLPDRVRWARELIERQSRHLTNLLEDLLDVSRITTGKITLKKSEIELGVVLSRAVEVSRPMIDARRHHFAIALPEVPLHIWGDPTRLVQIFGNLLDNAAKYTPEGGHIEIGVTLDDGHASVYVTDDGLGIAADELPHVFELFSQANRSLDRAQGGLGIGLSVVQSLVAMHDGTIELSSEGYGRGTRVRVQLPVIHARALDAISRKPRSTMPDRPLDILVVDDNVDAAESLTMLLEMRGHRVCMASDGHGALDHCLHHRTDVVLLDIGLPGMDGYDVARALRANPATRNAMLIAITGYGQVDDVKRASDAGFDHHLVKPVELDALIGLFEMRPKANVVAHKRGG
ncbi:hybrid sensor histidine kinase/response regulator [Paraburkholderia flava]|uniref:hybrid sensor histidine kinase/response regulator n=1 Tax=Paraburkholderia flava TaxID=2547393 RepID=UPI001F0E2460|nr:ATP-binding protein [Paraburkholderia flava]